MSELKYKIIIDHKEKGIGFTARTALQNSQKQKVSPIKKAKFNQQPNSNRTELEVLIDDCALTDFITSTINGSGRMPTDKSAYSILEVSLIDEKDNTTLNDQVKKLSRNYDKSQKQVSSLREENARLRFDLESSKTQVNNSLMGLLAYFESTNYSTQILLDDPSDLDFARRVISEDVANTFDNYVSHNFGERLSIEDIDRVLTYMPKESEEMAELKKKYIVATEEKIFLEKLKAGETEVPETLRQNYITIIEEKNLDEFIKNYESVIKEEEELKTKHITVKSLKLKYDSFAKDLEILNEVGSSVPVIFEQTDSGMNIYFPFRFREVKNGWVEGLREELNSYSTTSEAKVLEHQFLAYQLGCNNGFLENVKGIVEDTLVNLHIAGYNKIQSLTLSLD